MLTVQRAPGGGGGGAGGGGGGRGEREDNERHAPPRICLPQHHRREPRLDRRHPHRLRLGLSRGRVRALRVPERRRSIADGESNFALPNSIDNERHLRLARVPGVTRERTRKNERMKVIKRCLSSRRLINTMSLTRFHGSN